MNSDPHKLAKESGATFSPMIDCGPGIYDISMTETQLADFVEKIRAQERERCAVVCESVLNAFDPGPGAVASAAIRAGG